MTVYIGTYTVRGSVGIYRALLDPSSGRLTICGEVASDNPSFLALGADGHVLYAVNELNEGRVSAFAIDSKTGDLSALGQSRPTSGSSPCHLAVDGSGKWVVIANYASGSGAVFPVQSDGSLGEAVDRYQHDGSGPNAKRQTGPHAHSATFDGTGRRVYIADLGIDRMMVYQLNQETGRLSPAEPSQVTLAAGAGPRHMAFHPHRPLAFVINELGSTVTSFRYDGATGALETVDSASTLPPVFAGESTCADIHVHPNGRFVYGSNRGHDSIAVFALDEGSGELVLTANVTAGVAWPRSFALDPTGSMMLVANSKGDDIAVFSIDGETGLPRPTDQRCEVPSPVCVLFGEKPQKSRK